MSDLHEFLTPVHTAPPGNDASFSSSQFANHLKIYEDEFPDLQGVDIVIAGINEYRGTGSPVTGNAADAVRKKLYGLHYWHSDITVADIGNIKEGSALNDSYAAATIVLRELLQAGKTVVILGGSHDLTLAQYYSYKELGRIIDATVIDAYIDLKSESPLRNENFLMEMLTSEPNMVRHYNHIGFQSYFVHPYMLETLDKLRFDCFRVGKVKEKLSEMEPVIRHSDMLSFDIAAIRHSDAPAGACSPNGFTGEEACSLARYAGMADNLSTFGLYGPDPSKDTDGLTAMQTAQMIWYFIDGRNRKKTEPSLGDRQQFNEYHTFFAEVDTLFLQSKKTGRWWMQLPNHKMIACSYHDYEAASNNEIPERWLRAQEREA